jgi:hypothetical protein
VKVGQGNKTILIADLQVDILLILPLIKVFGSYIYRNFDPTKKYSNYLLKKVQVGSLLV